jgi:hypothetical protein
MKEYLEHHPEPAIPGGEKANPDKLPPCDEWELLAHLMSARSVKW